MLTKSRDIPKDIDGTYAFGLNNPAPIGEWTIKTASESANMYEVTPSEPNDDTDSNQAEFFDIVTTTNSNNNNTTETNTPESKLIRHFCNHPFYGENAGKAHFMGLLYSDYEYDLQRYEAHLKEHKGVPNPKVEQNFITTYGQTSALSTRPDFTDTIVSVSSNVNVTGTITEDGSLHLLLPRGALVSLDPRQLKDQGVLKRNDKFVRLACGTNYTIALTARGKIVFITEQAKEGAVIRVTKMKDAAVREGTEITDISAGSSQTIALTKEGQMYVWNSLDSIETSQMLLAKLQVPEMITELASEVIKQVSCGGSHTLALSVHGTVYGWGSNSNSQLGLSPDISAVTAPQLISSLPPAIRQVAAGYNHSCAHDGFSVYSWGSNEFGELGRKKGKNDFPTEVEIEEGMLVPPTPTLSGSSSTPLNASHNHVPHFSLASPPPFIRSVTCGTNTTSCVTIHGTVYIWGRLMNEKMTANQSVPRLVEFGDETSTNKRLIFFTQASVGATHACLLADTKVSDTMQLLNKFCDGDFMLMENQVQPPNIERLLFSLPQRCVKPVQERILDRLSLEKTRPIQVDTDIMVFTTVENKYTYTKSFTITNIGSKKCSVQIVHPGTPSPYNSVNSRNGTISPSASANRSNTSGTISSVNSNIASNANSNNNNNPRDNFVGVSYVIEGNHGESADNSSSDLFLDASTDGRNTSSRSDQLEIAFGPETNLSIEKKKSVEIQVRVTCPSQMTEEYEGVFTLLIETKKKKLRHFVMYRITPLSVWKSRLEWLDVLHDRWFVRGELAGIDNASLEKGLTSSISTANSSIQAIRSDEGNNNNNTNANNNTSNSNHGSASNYHSNTSFSTTSAEPHPALLLLSKDVDFTFLGDFLREEVLVKQEDRTIQLIEELNRQQKLIPVLYWIIKIELHKNRFGILREETVGSSVLKSLWFNFEGKQYLKAVIEPLVHDVAKAAKNKPLEIDPKKVEKEDARKNLVKLCEITKRFLKEFFNSRQFITDTLDAVLKLFFQQICETENKVKTKAHLGLGLSESSLQLFGAFFLLRMICPAIVSPQKYGLISELSPHSLRTLILISKMVQIIANQEEFQGNYMEVTNEALIRDSIPAMLAFIKKIATGAL